MWDRTHGTMRKKLLIATAALMPALAGCDALAYMGYLIVPPPPPKTVPAEFGNLAKHSAAIVIHIDPSAEYEYPGARLQLASLIAGHLRENVDGITVVDPRKVVRHQRENIYWDEMDRTQLGKQFEADYVLYVSLIEFSMREPGSLGLYRGNIKAEVSVYDTSLDERQALVWRGSDICAVYPPDSSSLPAEDNRTVHYKTANLFAEKLAKKFYKHKVPR